MKLEYCNIDQVFLRPSYRLGRLNDAFGCYSNALDIDPFFVDALLGRGNAWMDFGGEHGIVFGK